MSNVRPMRPRADRGSEPASVDAARVPPRSLDAEAAVLDTILLDGALALDRVADKLRPEHFWTEANRNIYEAAIEVREKGQPIDVVTVAESLRASDRLQRIGGSEYLAGLCNTTPNSGDIEAHALIIRNTYRIRALISRCQRLAALGYGAADAGAFEQSVREELDAALAQSEEDGGRMIGRDIDRIYQRLANRDDGALGLGIPTGLAQLDELTTGLHPGELTLIAGRPGMGKTSLALCVARNIAYVGWEDGRESGKDTYRYVVPFYSIEQPRDQILMRLSCIDGAIDSIRLRRGDLTGVEWQDFVGACARLRTLPVYLDDKPLTVARLRTDLRKLKIQAEAAKKKLAAAVVDYLQLMKGEGKDDNERISGISGGLKELSKEAEIPIIALCQLNRAVEKQEDKRPGLSDLRGSGSLEQDADNIIFVYRDDYYRERDEPPDCEAELIVAKQRNGKANVKATVKFYPGCTRFENA